MKQILRRGRTLNVLQSVFEQGEAKVYRVLDTITNNERRYLTLYTRGRFTVSKVGDPGYTNTPRTRGFISSDAGREPQRGEYVLHCEEAGEFLCVASRKRAILKGRVVELAAGAQLTIPQGQSLLIAEGATVEPVAGAYQILTAASADLTVTAREPLFGMLIWEKEP